MIRLKKIAIKIILILVTIIIENEVNIEMYCIINKKMRRNSQNFMYTLLFIFII
jgi:hypothetical protein